MKPLVNENGITVRQLKQWVQDLPEYGDNGEEYEVYLSNNERTSSIVKELWNLNEGDILLFSGEKTSSALVVKVQVEDLVEWNKEESK